ncbi:trypsin domain-containing protein [Ditylenchus destructor]|uniref:Trypsin domain-containing protein n=1 Tax=Ditylenchus destructor TaxID=166010 RepID=A0AAD4N2C0_9BILA|nr:trypsin domain-containing protein [Ditylenchus destructor]
MATISLLSLCLLATLSVVTSTPFEEVLCGTSDYPGDHAGERIIHGAVVPQGKYPWLAQLDPTGCTATILSRRFVLTATHCVLEHDPDKEKVTITVGSVNKHDGQKIRVKRVVPYEHSVNPNDIAIIELEEELSFSKDIRPICLSGKHQVGDPDKNVVITGWGEITGYGDDPDVLHEGTARILSDAMCKGYKSMYTPETLICMGSHNGTAPWHGDSGGPALLHEGKRWTQIGITSYGMAHEDGSADLAWPSAYTRISHFCDWIAENTNNEAKCDD